MPKFGKFFNVRIAFDATNDLMDKLITLGYMRNGKGKYAPIARDLLTEAVEQKIQSLEGKERTEFKTILESVKIKSLVVHMEREEGKKESLQTEEPSSQPGETGEGEQTTGDVLDILGR